MIKIFLLILIAGFSVGTQAKVTIGLPDQGRETLRKRDGATKAESLVDAKVSGDSTKTESSPDFSGDSKK